MKDVLQQHFIGSGTCITDTIASIQYEVIETSGSGLTLKRAKAIGTSTKKEALTYAELKDKHGRGALKIAGYENTELDNKILHLMVRSIQEEYSKKELQDKLDAIKEAEQKKQSREKERTRKTAALKIDLELGDNE